MDQKEAEIWVWGNWEPQQLGQDSKNVSFQCLNHGRAVGKSGLISKPSPMHRETGHDYGTYPDLTFPWCTALQHPIYWIFSVTWYLMINPFFILFNYWSLDALILAQAIETPSVRDEVEQVNCVCGARAEDGTFSGVWVQCDQCLAWLHGKCIGWEDGGLKGDYICPKCITKAAQTKVSQFKVAPFDSTTMWIFIFTIWWSAV